MSDLPTVSIVLVRAVNVPEGAHVRDFKEQALDRPDPWQWVYSVTAGGQKSADGDEKTDAIAAKLDERYVVLRLSDDPHLYVPSNRTYGTTNFDVDRFAGSPGDYDDQYVIARTHDLWQIQVVNKKENA